MATITLELPQTTTQTPAKRQLDFRRLHAIKTEEEFDSVVLAIHALFDKGERRSATENDLLEFLSILADAYEEKHVETPTASPQDLVAFMLDQNGMTRADLYAPMGGKGRVSEFFSHKRQLSRQQMVAIRDLLHIPLDLLV